MNGNSSLSCRELCGNRPAGQLLILLEASFPMVMSLMS